jgi:CRISPR/Cas system-associated protein Cas10 (large subunit of type III CRISPR-Cas system)
MDDMQAISEQMSANRHQGVAEVVSFIDKQAKDAHDQAKKLVDDAIDRIVKASKNIYTYIENRRQAKVGESFIIEIEHIFLCLSLADWMNV